MRNIKAKKYLGQHFLVNKLYARRTCEILNSNKKNKILEIGPGMGVLTEFLIDYDLKLIEIDLEAVKYLKKKIPKNQTKNNTWGFS